MASVPATTWIAIAAGTVVLGVGSWMVRRRFVSDPA